MVRTCPRARLKGLAFDLYTTIDLTVAPEISKQRLTLQVFGRSRDVAVVPFNNFQGAGSVVLPPNKFGTADIQLECIFGKPF